MILSLKYFISKNLAFTYDFLTEIFGLQQSGVNLWFYYGNISLAKICRFPMFLLLKFLVGKNLAFSHGFIIEIFH